jgi:hypothetical protein
MSKSQGDRRKLGWLAAGLLFTVLSSPAWGLDLDREIAQSEIDNAARLAGQTPLWIARKRNPTASFKCSSSSA